ncbi:MAG: glutamate--tRNA ligase [bacterium]|nr:glutamate--tRNA ligase [bacterium]
MTTVITRFPPSPTGAMHVGTAKTALMNYLFAKKSSGKIILRWEDTDHARSKKEYEREMFEGLEWLGFIFDEIYHQSERALIYKKYVGKMIADGNAYLSEESQTATLSEFAENDESDTLSDSPQKVVRFKNPNKIVTFTDLVRGEISVDTTELGDFVIARSIEEPLYHLAVVIDDFEMGITHVIRGEDGIYNTPRQILIQEAIGAPRPVYAHFPFILGKDKSKLSKRNGSVPVSKYREQGILPAALINYLALLGWNPGTDQEIFTLKELTDCFDLSLIQKSGGIFDEEKLIWFNREHIKRLSLPDFKKYLFPYLPQSVLSMPQWSEERFSRFLPELRERISVLTDIGKLVTEGELDYIFSEPKYEGLKLLPKESSAKSTHGKKEALITARTIDHHLSHILSLLEKQDEKIFDKKIIKDLIWDYADKEGRGAVLWPLRFALSGRDKSPDPFVLCEILGKEESLKRIRYGIELIKENLA